MLQARAIVEAAQRLVAEKGNEFTIQDLVTEADVALQTFYRYFPGKDELLLAVLEDLIAQACVLFEERARPLTDPVSRLRSHVASVFETLEADDGAPAGGRFVAAEHWRLAQLFPEEIAQATGPYTGLLEAEILAGLDAGLLHSTDPHRDAWFMSQLVLSVYHHQSCMPNRAPSIADDIWGFCAGALSCEA